RAGPSVSTRRTVSWRNIACTPTTRSFESMNAGRPRQRESVRVGVGWVDRRVQGAPRPSSRVPGVSSDGSFPLPKESLRSLVPPAAAAGYPREIAKELLKNGRGGALGPACRCGGLPTGDCEGTSQEWRERGGGKSAGARTAALRGGRRTTSADGHSADQGGSRSESAG